MSALQWDQYSLTWHLIEPLLGTLPKDPDVFTRHVRNQETGTDEHVPPLAEEEKGKVTGWTTFPVDELGRPVLLDYQMLGFLKEAGNTIKDQIGVKNLRSHIGNTVFVTPRRILLAEKVDDYYERPLRAMTAQGPRVSVVKSDMILPGKTYQMMVKVLQGSKVTEQVLRACVEYGEMKGLLQFRGGGFGRFKGELVKV